VNVYVTNFAGQKTEKITTPTAVQARAFERSAHRSRSGSRSQKPHPGIGAFPQVNPPINLEDTT